MNRTALLTAVPAALLTAAIGAAVVNSPVSADAAAPFAVSKPAFTKVQKTSVAALKLARVNGREIDELRTASVAAAGTPGPVGPAGPQGPAGGVDPSSITRVVGPAVAISVLGPVGATVSCPAPSLALSGGWYLSAAATQTAFTATRSYPVAGMKSWGFRFAYSGPGIHTVTPYAVCVGA